MTRNSPVCKRYLYGWFSRFGEVAEVWNCIQRSGVCYVMFYDSRCAAAAACYGNQFVAETVGAVEMKRSRPFHDAAGRPPDPRDRQGTVLITLQGTSRGFSNADRKMVEGFGAVHRFSPYGGRPTEWAVEYYDSRAADSAAECLHGKPKHGGTMYTTFLWDGSIQHTASKTNDYHKSRKPMSKGQSWPTHDQKSPMERGFQLVGTGSAGAHESRQRAARADSPRSANHYTQDGGSSDTPSSPISPHSPVSVPIVGTSQPKAREDADGADPSEGINRLLDILAQVQRSSYSPK